LQIATAPPFVSNITIVSLDIFDRWGNHLHHETGNIEGWNGNFRGEPCPQGIYSYMVQYLPDEQVVEQLEAGTVLLVR
jgi:gliding motility-associated-like protein